jgi:3-oxoacyl-[acyl-carrier protein] reductase
MNMDFQGQVVLVTGAGRGIGAAIARAFAAHGAAVAVNYLRDAASAEAVAKECRDAGGDALAIQADVRDAQAASGLVQTVVNEFGRLDVVVNNAFAPYAFDPEQRQPYGELTWDHYRAQFEGAVGATHQVCRASLPHLTRHARGAIVNIATNLIDHPVVAYHDYSTAKSALVGFSRNLAAELGPQGVRVNCVAPGLVYPTQASAGTRAGFRDAIAAATPLRRLARPEDVTGPVLFLASSHSAFMTGQVLFVDGGLVMR